MEGMKAYSRYQALKLHFTSDYDFVKYGGKIRTISQEAFLKRKDQYLFRKLERKYSDEELTEFFVANFISKAGVRWVGEMNGPESEKVYLNWRKKIEAFSYFLKQDLQYIEDNVDKPRMVLATKGEHPQLLRLYLGGKVSAETIISFDKVIDTLDTWNRIITDTIVWPEVYRQLNKYKPFVKADKDSIKKVMREVFAS